MVLEPDVLFDRLGDLLALLLRVVVLAAAIWFLAFLAPALFAAPRVLGDVPGCLVCVLVVLASATAASLGLLVGAAVGHPAGALLVLAAWWALIARAAVRSRTRSG